MWNSLNALIIGAYLLGALSVPVLLIKIKSWTMVVTAVTIMSAPVVLMVADAVSDDPHMWIATSAIALVCSTGSACLTGRLWQWHHHSIRVVEVEVEHEVLVHEAVPATDPDPPPGQWRTLPPPKE